MRVLPPREVSVSGLTRWSPKPKPVVRIHHIPRIGISSLPKLSPVDLEGRKLKHGPELKNTPLE